MDREFSNQMDRPLLSVIIPVYNREKYISEAVDSVLAQNYNPMELIVVDDGSTDQTRCALKKYQEHIAYIYQKNGGVAGARNTGLKAAKGKFTAFIDSDDVWAPFKLKKQISLFDENPSLEIAIGFTVTFRNVLSEMKTEQKYFELSLGSALIKPSVFNAIGAFDEDLKLGEDTDWFLRARENGTSIAIHNDVVSYVRKHSGNITNDSRMRNYYFFKVLKKVKDRKASSGQPSAAKMLKPENVEDLISLWHTADISKTQ